MNKASPNDASRNEVSPNDAALNAGTTSEILCEVCRLHREKFQSIALAVYFSSLFSCGLLWPIAIPTGVILQLISFRKCHSCRGQKKLLK